MSWRKFSNYLEALLCKEDSAYLKVAYSNVEAVEMASDEEMMLELGLDPSSIR